MPKPVNTRVAALRERRTKAGLKRLEVWAHPDDHEAIKSEAARLAKAREAVAVETFIQPAADDIPEVEIFRVHGIKGHTDMTREVFEYYQARQSERQFRGRYTLEEAAMRIAQETGTDASSMLYKLMQAVRNRTIHAYLPNRLSTHRPAKNMVREWYEEVYWDDLKTWFAAETGRHLSERMFLESGE